MYYIIMSKYLHEQPTLSITWSQWRADRMAGPDEAMQCPQAFLDVLNDDKHSVTMKLNL